MNVVLWNPEGACDWWCIVPWVSRNAPGMRELSRAETARVHPATKLASCGKSFDSVVYAEHARILWLALKVVGSDDNSW